MAATKSIAFGIMLLLASVAWGQMVNVQYSGSSTFGFSTNFPQCTTGGYNCWHAMPGFAPKIFSGNGKTYAIDSTGTGNIYNEYPTNSWTPHDEWGTVYELEQGADGNLYGLYGPGGGTCINEGAHSIGEWNGSTWVQVSYCYTDFSFAANGGMHIMAVDLNGTLWEGSPGGSWAHVANAPSPIAQVSFINDYVGSYIAVKTDATIWYFNGTTLTQLPGGASQVASDVNGSFYILSAGYIYHWSGSAWQQMGGGNGFTWLANGGSMDVWTIGATVGGKNVYRFSDTGIVHTRTVSGSSICNGSPCSTNHHSAHVQACWGTSSPTCGPGDSLTNQPTTGSMDVSDSVLKHDLFDCLEANPNCTPTVGSGGGASCTIVGTLYADNITIALPDSEQALVRGKITSVSRTRDSSGNYTETMENYCTPATTPADVNIGGNTPVDLKYNDPSIVAVDLKAACFRWPVIGMPWICSTGSTNYQGSYWSAMNIGESYWSDPGPGSCTYNP